MPSARSILNRPKVRKAYRALQGYRTMGGGHPSSSICVLLDAVDAILDTPTPPLLKLRKAPELGNSRYILEDSAERSLVLIYPVEYVDRGRSWRVDNLRTGRRNGTTITTSHGRRPKEWPLRGDAIRWAQAHYGELASGASHFGRSESHE